MKDTVCCDSSFSVPNLTLNNFEEEGYTDCRYVLTSPRSLDACSRIGVKPRELLYKGLTDFQIELLPQDLTLAEIYQKYSEHEKHRQSQLKLCRDIRRMITSQDTLAGINSTSNLVETLRNNNCAIREYCHDAYTTEDGSKELSSAPEVLFDHAPDLHALEHRLDDIKKERLRLNSELDNRKIESNAATQRSRRSRSVSPHAHSRRGKVKARSKSMVGSRDKASVQLKANPRKPFSSSSQDEKILRLMVWRNEMEQEEFERRRKCHAKWDRERDAWKRVNDESATHRRNLLAREMLINSHKLEKLKRSTKENDDKKREELVKKLNEKDNRWATMSSRQHVAREAERQWKSEHERRRKLSLERQREEMRKEMEAVNGEILHEALRGVTIAEIRKNRSLERLTKQKQLENDMKMKEHRDRKSLLDNLSREKRDMEADELRRRQGRAESNYSDVLTTQDNRRIMASIERDRRMVQVHSSLNKMESERELYHDMLLKQQQQACSKATRALEETLERKSRTASYRLAIKEKEQQANRMK